MAIRHNLLCKASAPGPVYPGLRWQGYHGTYLSAGHMTAAMFAPCPPSGPRWCRPRCRGGCRLPTAGRMCWTFLHNQKAKSRRRSNPGSNSNWIPTCLKNSSTKIAIDIELRHSTHRLKINIRPLDQLIMRAGTWPAFHLACSSPGSQHRVASTARPTFVLDVPPGAVVGSGKYVSKLS